MSGTITISGDITGGAAGTKKVNVSFVSSTATAVITETVLQSGANTITIPANSSGVVVKLPSTNTAITTLKGVTGDTGIALGKTGSFMLTWDSTAVPASFVLNSAATQTGLYTQFTFF